MKKILLFSVFILSLFSANADDLYNWGYKSKLLGIGAFPKKLDSSETWKDVCIGGHSISYITSNGNLNIKMGFHGGVFADSTSKWEKVVCNFENILALKEDGSLWQIDSLLWNTKSKDLEKKLKVVDSSNEWESISCGSNYYMAIKKDGSLWGWGENTYGNIGDGTQIRRDNPVQIGTDKDWKSVSAGYFFSSAIKQDGSLWAWGSIKLKGNNDSNFKLILFPQKISDENNWLKVSCNVYSMLAIKDDGSLWGCGENIDGELGYGYYAPLNELSQIGKENNWKDCNLSFFHSVAIKKDGTLWTAGSNVGNHLGIGSSAMYVLEFTRVGNSNNWEKCGISNYQNSLAIQKDNSVWAWGFNDGDVLGYNIDQPHKLEFNQGWKHVSCGSESTAAIADDGSLWEWDYMNRNPTLINNDKDWKIVEFNGIGIAIKNDGTLWRLNLNNYDTLKPKIYKLSETNDWATLVKNEVFMAVKKDGTLWQMDDDNLKPFLRFGNHSFEKIAAGGSHIIGLKKDGTIWGWGRNQSGELGLSGVLHQNEFAQIGSDSDWASVFCGYYNSFAIKKDGTLWATGDGFRCVLGDSNYSRIHKFMKIGIDNDWLEIASSYTGTLALKEDGSLWGWGGDVFSYFKLNNDWDFICTPTRIGRSNKWKKIACSDNTACALMDNSTNVKDEQLIIFNNHSILFPNPIHCGKTIKFNSSGNISNVSIYDLLGNNISIIVINNEIILPSNLNPGIYIFNYKLDDKFKIDKFVVVD